MTVQSSLSTIANHCPFTDFVKCHFFLAMSMSTFYEHVVIFFYVERNSISGSGTGYEVALKTLIHGYGHISSHL